MNYTYLLKQKLGLGTYTKMLNRSKPRNKEQWAHEVYLRLRGVEHKQKRRENAKQAIREILRRGTPLGTEDLDQVNEWLEIL
jgi:hypothetical protein